MEIDEQAKFIISLLKKLNQKPSDVDWSNLSIDLHDYVLLLWRKEENGDNHKG